MLIPDTLFDCIKHDIGVVSFIPINLYSVRAMRVWRRHTPEQRAAKCKKMSETRLKKYADDLSLRKKMSDGMKEYWKNLSAEKRELQIKKLSDGMKKAWKEGGKTFGSSKGSFAKKIKIKHDVPRINTYSGVLTESQLDELNA